MSKPYKVWWKRYKWVRVVHTNTINEALHYVKTLSPIMGKTDTLEIRHNGKIRLSVFGKWENL